MDRTVKDVQNDIDHLMDELKEAKKVHGKGSVEYAEIREVLCSAIDELEFRMLHDD